MACGERKRTGSITSTENEHDVSEKARAQAAERQRRGSMPFGESKNAGSRTPTEEDDDGHDTFFQHTNYTSPVSVDTVVCTKCAATVTLQYLCMAVPICSSLMPPLPPRPLPL